MKILLLTDIPPCENFTAGLVLDKLVRFLDPDDLMLCTITNPAIAPVVPADLRSLPTLNIRKPREAALRLLPGLLGSGLAYFFELLQSLRVRWFILPQIVSFARRHNVEAIWVVLQGQTIVRLARPLSQKLGVPLFSQVWDPFGWWLRDNKIDGLTQSSLLTEFDKVIVHSTSCATASWAMSETYSRQYKIRNRPVIAGMEAKYSFAPATEERGRGEFVIGMAGQFYAQDEWRALIRALDHVNWSIEGRRIRIRILGGHFDVRTSSPANFEYLGWQTQIDAINLLADSDLLYLPYWFSEVFREETSNSFPSKLVTYFASGRPVFCHAPRYASPAKYITKHGAGFICDTLDEQQIVKVLGQAITDKSAYKLYAKNGADCFLRDFTLERMRETFLEFLQVEGQIPSPHKN